jgi:hypothetical protein
MTKLYLAYGSNMNKAQMRRRCPAAKPLRAIVIDDARLVFRGVADIEFCQGASVPVVLWEITDACERALDRFEGVANGVYEKRTIPLDNGEDALTYVMCSNGISPPTREYFERIKQGYADFEIDPEPLDVALKHSHVKQQHSAETRRRMARTLASGVVHRVAPRPMHVPLDKVDPALAGTGNTTTVGGLRSWSERGVEDGICKHGWPHGVCEECASEPPLPLPKPDPRYDGYNWSAAAKAGTAATKLHGDKAYRKTGTVVYTDRDEAQASNKKNRVAPKRTNAKKIKVRKNLSDWLKEKGYSGENH